jgi:prophage regulatory protein
MAHVKPGATLTKVREVAGCKSRWIGIAMVYKKVVRRSELKIITALSLATLSDIQNPKSPRFDPSFPPKIRLGARAVGWFLEDVLQWLDSRKEVAKQGGQA